MKSKKFFARQEQKDEKLFACMHGFFFFGMDFVNRIYWGACVLEAYWASEGIAEQDCGENCEEKRARKSDQKCTQNCKERFKIHSRIR